MTLGLLVKIKPDENLETEVEAQLKLVPQIVHKPIDIRCVYENTHRMMSNLVDCKLKGSYCNNQLQFGNGCYCKKYLK